MRTSSGTCKEWAWRDGRSLAGGKGLFFVDIVETPTSCWLYADTTLSLACYFLASTGLLVDVDVDVECGTPVSYAGYICKRPQNLTHTDTDTRTVNASASAVAATQNCSQSLQCPSGWVGVNGSSMSKYCYLMQNPDKRSWSWFDAHRECSQQGADLLYIESTEELAAISNYVQVRLLVALIILYTQ